MHTYERLSGASGRRVFYRAERFKARDLFPQATAKVEIDNTQLALEDLSMTGLSAIAPGSAMWSPRIGDEFAVRLLLDNMVLHEGRARICRIGRQKCGVRIGLGLTTDYLDIAEVIGKRNRLQLESEIARGLDTDSGLIEPEYRTSFTCCGISGPSSNVTNCAAMAVTRVPRALRTKRWRSARSG